MTNTNHYFNGRDRSLSGPENNQVFRDNNDPMTGHRTEMSVQQDIRAQIVSPIESGPYANTSYTNTNFGPRGTHSDQRLPISPQPYHQVSSASSPLFPITASGTSTNSAPPTTLPQYGFNHPTPESNEYFGNDFGFLLNPFDMALGTSTT